MHLPIEMELRAYTHEREQWFDKLQQRIAKGREGLTPKMQKQYNLWEKFGHTRQLIFDVTREKVVSQRDKVKLSNAQLKKSCVGVALKLQPDDASSVQVMIRIGVGPWRELRCYYGKQAEFPVFAEMAPGPISEVEAEMEESDDEVTDAESIDEEEMVIADGLMAAGCDVDEGKVENLELDVQDVIELHVHAKEDSGMSASHEEFKGHFLCMFILRYTLT